MQPVLHKELQAQGLHLRCHVWPQKQARAHCRGHSLFHGVAPSPLGDLLLVWSAQWGLCHLEFHKRVRWDDVRHVWPDALWQEDSKGARDLTRRICFPEAGDPPLDLLLHGPDFHIAVWLALLDVPRGEIVSYQELARRSGKPGAARAVGTAMSTNPISYVVPCHRVVRADGNTGNYGGGADLKIRMLEWEAEDGPMPRHI